MWGEEVCRELEVSHHSSKRKGPRSAPRGRAARQPRARLAEGLCWKLASGWRRGGNASWCPWQWQGCRVLGSWWPGKLNRLVAGTRSPCEEVILLKDSRSSMFYKSTISTRLLLREWGGDCLLQATSECKLSPHHTSEFDEGFRQRANNGSVLEPWSSSSLTS